MHDWQNTPADPYELSGIARRDQKAYENWRDSDDDDGHEMSRLFNQEMGALRIKPIKQRFHDEF